MSVYGALYGAVSGLGAQSEAIAMRSDNIVNINTNGYKSRSPFFATLVTNVNSATKYSSGGVSAIPTYNIDSQGLLESTGVNTHLSINGQGLFVVSDDEDATEGGYKYSRVGSFIADANGTFRNTSGFVLFAWPVDNEGRLPGEIGNLNTTSSALLTSLEPVNVRSATNAVAATSQIDLSMNLDQRTNTLEGAGETVTIPNVASANNGIGELDLIVPNANIDNGYNLLVTGSLATYTFTYGGVTNSADISLGILGASNSTQIFTGATSGDNFTISSPQVGNVTFTYTPSNPDTISGQFNNLSSLAEAINRTNGISARISGSQLFVGPSDANQSLTFTDNVGTFAGSLAFGNIAASGNNLLNDGIVTGNDYTVAPIYGAGDTTTVLALAAGDTIDVIVNGAAPVTFAFVNPPVAPGDFSTLGELVTQINATVTLPGVYAEASTKDGVTAIRIRPDDPTHAITFAEAGPTAGKLAALGFTNITATTGTVNRFNTLSGLNTLFETADGISGNLTSPTAETNLKIFNDDPYGSIYYSQTYPLPSEGDILTEFGITEYDATSATTIAATTFGPAYDPLGATAPNMASGTIAPNFTQNIEIFDSFGSSHNLFLSFVKTGINTWSAEIYGAIPTEIVSTRSDGLIASGQIQFNGDGSLRSVEPIILNPISIQYDNGSLPMSITFNWGNAGEPEGTFGATNIGDRSGLGQIARDNEILFIDQNGVSASLLQSIEISEKGEVIAQYRNGLSKQLYKIPLAEFRNPNALTETNNNTYLSSEDAGNFNLREADQGLVGTISSGKLEQSNVDLADELTRLITAQRSYEANTQVISAANNILERLNRLFG